MWLWSRFALFLGHSRNTRYATLDYMRPICTNAKSNETDHNVFLCVYDDSLTLTARPK